MRLTHTFRINKNLVESASKIVGGVSYLMGKDNPMDELKGGFDEVAEDVNGGARTGPIEIGQYLEQEGDYYRLTGYIDYGDTVDRLAGGVSKVVEGLAEIKGLYTELKDLEENGDVEHFDHPTSDNSDLDENILH